MPEPSNRLLRALLLATLVSGACAPPDRGTPESHQPALRTGTPSAVGFDSAGIARIGPAMQQLVDEGRVAGVVTLVARDGVVVHWDAHGWRVLGEDPLERNDVFRIYSMTKPVTSVAAMMLVEEGSLGLDDPLSLYIPAFADVQVLDGGVLRPPESEITIRDLLRHTSGLTYGIFGDTPVDRIYREHGNMLDLWSGRSLEETVDVIAELPLLADPGTVWNYSVSVDVLGRVVEVVSGETLADFFRDRIFEPLGMHETAFRVAPENADRLVSLYTGTPSGLVPGRNYVGSFTREPSWYSGGGGLTSTPGDYLRFAQMLLNGGELEGVRVLRETSIREMTRDQLPAGHGPISLSPTDGFGLGFAVETSGPTPGVFWWPGVANTWFWVDPVERIVAFVWTQHDPFGGLPINPMMRRLVYEALAESNRMAAAGAP